MIPSINAIAAHEARGGIWRIVPAPKDKQQPRPSFALLTVVRGRSGPIACFEGGDMASTLADHDNAHLHTAEWIAVDSRGERIESP